MSSEPGRSARCGGLRVISCLIVIWIQSRSTSALFANHSCPVLGAGVSPRAQHAAVGARAGAPARGLLPCSSEARGEGHYSEAAHTSAHSRSHSTTRRYCYPRHAPNQHGSDSHRADPSTEVERRRESAEKFLRVHRTPAHTPQTYVSCAAPCSLMQQHRAYL